MRIALGADHGGYLLKKSLHVLLEKLGHTVVNVGVDGPAPADYPDYARKVAETVIRGDAKRGIIVCGSGVGACVAANKVPGIRAGLCHIFPRVRGRTRRHVNVPASRTRHRP